jgi:hypothetical protein
MHLGIGLDISRPALRYLIYKYRRVIPSQSFDQTRRSPGDVPFEIKVQGVHQCRDLFKDQTMNAFFSRRQQNMVKSTIY